LEKHKLLYRSRKTSSTLVLVNVMEARSRGDVVHKGSSSRVGDARLCRNEAMRARYVSVGVGVGVAVGSSAGRDRTAGCLADIVAVGRRHR
jgi:hypothetical protein